ncbi:unnamed protein product [Gongylonema pulchrum]|uniref:t-SNARE coiled-coil homology domain-containing protein n=1 Tax=Gongylonema pulchrum TaxID=637853 RepID=A0A183CW65_9BILA|nr:unnamed protein product [Gongylonema pulchrum]
MLDATMRAQLSSHRSPSPASSALLALHIVSSMQEAEQYGDVENVKKLQQQIDDLESRATELDRRRSQSVRAINWINQRNRQAIKDAVLSGQIQIETSSQDDPFTRKNARMKPVSGKDKLAQQSSDEKFEGSSGSQGKISWMKWLHFSEVQSVTV